MRFLHAASFVLLASAALPSTAGDGPSLNGTWQGSYGCKTEDAGGKDNFKSSDSVLTILQTGPGTLLADLDGPYDYSGTLVPSDADPFQGAGALIACGTSDSTAGDAYNEITTFHYKVDSEGGGSLKVSGAYVTNGSEVGVCKGSFKRVSTGATKLPTCE